MQKSAASQLCDSALLPKMCHKNLEKGSNEMLCPKLNLQQGHYPPKTAPVTTTAKEITGLVKMAPQCF